MNTDRMVLRIFTGAYGREEHLMCELWKKVPMDMPFVVCPDHGRTMVEFLPVDPRTGHGLLAVMKEGYPRKAADPPMTFTMHLHERNWRTYRDTLCQSGWYETTKK
jgi:hypothetical protein